MKKYFAGILLLFTLISSCYVQSKYAPFYLREARYQSWMESARNKGTRITIILADVDKTVTFDSVIFRGARVPVSSLIENDSVAITGIIPAEGSVSPVIPHYTTAPNQLIYHYKGSRCSLLLKNVKRDNMEY